MRLDLVYTPSLLQFSWLNKKTEKNNIMRMTWRHVLDLHTCLKIFPNCCRQDFQMSPKVLTLYNPFPLSEGRTCEYDGRSLPWVCYLIWQCLRDFADVIRILINWLWLKREIFPYQAQLYRWVIIEVRNLKGDFPARHQGAGQYKFYRFKRKNPSNRRARLEEDPEYQMRL